MLIYKFFTSVIVFCFVFTIKGCSRDNNYEKKMEPELKKEENESREKYDFLLTEINQAMPGIKQCEGKDVILVVGNTGVGKSTLINYATGMKFIKKKSKPKDDSDDDDTEYRIEKVESNLNNEMEMSSVPGMSCTKYPAVAQIEENTFLCDTAGFGDTNYQVGETLINREELTYILIDLVIKTAKSIKGIFVVVSNLDLQENSVNRSKPLFDLSSILSRLFNGPEFYDSLYLIINNKAKRGSKLSNVDKCLEKMSDISNSLKNKVKGIENNTNIYEVPIIKEKLDAAAFIEIFVTLKNCISIAPHDENSQKTILETIKKMKSIPKDTFMLNKFNPYIESLRIRFGKTIDLGLSCINKINGIRSSEIGDISQRLVVNKFAIIDSENNVESSEIENLKNQITEAEEILSLCKEDFTNKEKNLFELQNDRTPYNIPYPDQYYNEKTLYGCVKKGVVHTNTFTCKSDFPILYCKEVEESDLITVPDGIPSKFENKIFEENKASITYYTPSNYYGAASFLMYIEYRHSEEGRRKIKDAELDINRIKDDICNSENMLQGLRNILQSKYGEKNSKNEKLVELKNEKSVILSKLDDIKLKIEKQKETFLELEATGNFDSVQKLCEQLQLDIPFMREFALARKNFIKDTYEPAIKACEDLKNKYRNV